MDNDDVKAYGISVKGNGEFWLYPELHSTLTVGGGQAGQGYPCILQLTKEKEDKGLKFVEKDE